MNERDSHRPVPTRRAQREGAVSVRARRALVLVALIVSFLMFPAIAPTRVSPAAAQSTPAGLAPASADDPIVIAAGDIACPQGKPATPRSCQQEATANLVLAQKPTAVLTLGDEQYECGKISQFNNAFDASWGRFKNLIHPAPGNHEYNNGGEAPVCGDVSNDAAGYYQYFGAAANPLDPSCTQQCQGYYSFDLGSWHLIALNSNCVEAGGCDVGSPEVEWLQADLAAHPSECTIAFWHHPRFSSGQNHGNDPAMQTFWSVLANAGVDLALVGHEHDYERFAAMDADGAAAPAGGMREIVVGTGGRDLYGFKANVDATSEVRSSSFGVLRLGLHQGWYDWRFLPIPGETFTDSGTGTCHSAAAAASAALSTAETAATPAPTIQPPTATVTNTRTPLPTVTAVATAQTSTPSTDSTPAVAQEILFQDAFENGNLDQWTQPQGWTVEQPASGGHVLHNAGEQSTNFASVAFTHPSSETFTYLRVNVRETLASALSLFGVIDANQAAIATLGLDQRSFITLTNGATGETIVSHTPVTSGVWHAIELHVRSDGASTQTEVWIDGVYLTSLCTNTAGKTGAANSILIGDSDPDHTAVVDFDDVVVATQALNGAALALTHQEPAAIALAIAPIASIPVGTPAPTLASVALAGSPVPAASPAVAMAAVAGTSDASPPTIPAPPKPRQSWDEVKSIASVLVLLISLFLTAQGFFTLGLMLYTWARADRLIASGSPSTFAEPKLRFTAIVPARHEREVIAHTVRRIWNANYPKDLLEVVVVCEHTDFETIEEAEQAARDIGHANVRVLSFSDGPINKPHGLNFALRHTTHEVVTIFDAEDDVHADVFNLANTVMLRDGAGIVQAGVQLMDFQSTWFAVHNVLEYFFWFKSRLHFHAQVGMVPLGGNTVFMRRKLIEMVGGWDEQCLTEDADIGIRLSTLGERISITYDAEHATREETPPTLVQFVKQRTRWNQGFLQVLRKGVWKRFPKRSQRLLAGYTLTYPFIQAFFGLLWIPALVATFALKLNVAVAMVSLLPLYALVFQFSACLLGLFDFARAYKLRVRPRDLAIFSVSFMPYQILLSFGALRAVYREQRGRTNWEKTAHTGAHRSTAPKRVLEGDHA